MLIVKEVGTVENTPNGSWATDLILTYDDYRKVIDDQRLS